MALAGLALRIAAREVLKGATWAGPDVIDTLGVVSEMDGVGPRFSIVVASDGGDEREVRLVLTLSVLVLLPAETERGAEWQVPLTSAAAEMALDVLERQAIGALRHGHGLAAALRGIAGDMAVTSQRAENVLAAQRVLVITATAPEPKPNDTTTDRWVAFLREIEAARIHPAEKAVLRQAIAGQAVAMPDWASLFGIESDAPRARAPRKGKRT
jgi:hypothetical protein